MATNKKSYLAALSLWIIGSTSEAAMSRNDFNSIELKARKPIKGVEEKYDGLENLNLPTVPNLIGKDPRDPQVVKDELEGTGFTVIVSATRKSETVPKGAVISQTPKENTEAKKAGVILVVISDGK
jgi:hypothetical protein